MDEIHEIHSMMDIKESPAFSFCPKCGSNSFNSKNRGRSFKCEVCQFHFFVNNSAAVACLIINAEGKLLLARRALDPNKGMLDLPGGFVDPLETAEQAVMREIMEELNLTVAEMSYLTSFPNLYPYSDFVVPTLDMAFICEVSNFESLKAGDDVASVEFIQPDLIDLSALCSESMKQIIQYYLERIKY